jgi:hypothetical protein
MSNSPISQALRVKLTTAGRWVLACTVMTVLTMSMGHAQLTTPATGTWEIRSGIHLVAAGHTPSITASEVGRPTALSKVRIELRDATGRLVAAANGDLGPGRPVHLRPQIPADAGLQELSAIVRVTSLVDGGNKVMTVWEDIGPDSFISRNIVCGPGALGGGGQQMCQGWSFTVQPDQPQ